MSMGQPTCDRHDRAYYGPRPCPYCKRETTETEERVRHYVQCGRDCCEPCDRVHDAIVRGDRTATGEESVREVFERLSIARVAAAEDA